MNVLFQILDVILCIVQFMMYSKKIDQNSGIKKVCQKNPHIENQNFRILKLKYGFRWISKPEPEWVSIPLAEEIVPQCTTWTKTPVMESIVEGRRRHGSLKALKKIVTTLVWKQKPRGTVHVGLQGTVRETVQPYWKGASQQHSREGASLVSQKRSRFGLRSKPRSPISCLMRWFSTSASPPICCWYWWSNIL